MKICKNTDSVMYFLFAILLWSATSAVAQDSGPKRGFNPGGSFALSDIESINMTNGNMMLHFPLAALPAGRGGERTSTTTVTPVGFGIMEKIVMRVRGNSRRFQ